MRERERERKSWMSEWLERGHGRENIMNSDNIGTLYNT